MGVLFSYRYINLLREIVDCSPKLASFSLRYLPVSIKGLTFAPKYDYDARRVGVKMLAKTNINKANEQVLRSNVDFSALFKGLYLGESEILLTHTHTHTHTQAQAVITHFQILSYARAKRAVNLASKGLPASSLCSFCHTLLPPGASEEISKI